jgi:hypothetical protein
VPALQWPRGLFIVVPSPSPSPSAVAGAVPPKTASYQPPPIKHVWVIMLENESFGYTFGPSGHKDAL